MLSKKRFMLIFITLFLFSLLTVSAFSKHQQINLHMDDEDCDSGSMTGGVESVGDNALNWADNYGACDKDEYRTTIGKEGCDILIANEGPDSSDECAQYRATSGFFLENNKGKLKNFALSTGDVGVEKNDDSAQCFNDYTWHSGSATSYLCGFDTENSRHYWFDCTSTDASKTFTIPLDKNQPKIKTTFICLLTKDSTYIWQNINEIDERFDADQDLVPFPIDCNDDNDQIFPAFPEGCVEPNEKGEVPKNKVKCIVPASPEIAGNDIDENCDGKLVKDIDDDKDSCETATLNANNVAYYWMTDAPKGSQCCGDDVEDFGQTFDTAAGQRVCLPKDSKKTGVAGGKVEEVAGSSACNGDWCAPLASTGNLHFRIFTIKKPGQEPYDIVSDGENWQTCNEANKNINLADNAVGENILPANGFSCYKEGDRWVWVYCKPEGPSTNTIDNGIKNRNEGDGLFALPLKVDDKGEPTEAKSVVPIDIKTLYTSFYNTKSFDLIQQDGKQFLEAYIRFTNPKIISPAIVNLKIYGPTVKKDNKNEKVIYFDQPILGYATNTPLLEPNRWIHVKIPLPTLYDVTELDFYTSLDKNLIQVRNVYLTYGDTPKICSGEESSKTSAWLTDLDTWSEGNDITGEKLCNILFDPLRGTKDHKDAAWLGGSEVTKDDAHCCGNQEHEYYAGPSQLINEKDYYGCWNSEPVKANSSVMDVKVDLSSNFKEKIFSYPKDFNVEYKLEGEFVCKPGEFYSAIDYCTTKTPVIKTCNTITSETECKKADNCAYLENKCTEYDPPTVFSFSNLLTVTFKDFKFVQQPTFKDLIFKKQGGDSSSNLNLFQSTYKLSFVKIKPLVTNENKEEKHISLSNNGQPLSEENGYITISLADVDKITYSFSFTDFSADFFKTIAPEIEEKSNLKLSTLTFSCLTSECTYPLPGESPYKITNPHPELYELYFIEADAKGKLQETLITEDNQEFKNPGNIRVKKLAQQVLFTSNGLDAAFHGCNVADYLLDETKVITENNKGYCNTAGGKYFCAPSTEKESAQNKNDKYTVIDSWSKEPLTKVGYDLSNTKEIDSKTFHPKLRDLTEPIDAVQRNHSSTVLATRNFIPNAEFATANNKLPGWGIFNDKNEVTESEFLSVSAKDKTINLNAQQILRSERIAIPPDTKLKFTVNSSCTPTLQLVGDKTETINPSQDFSTGTARYLIIEFTGSCKISQPFLQLIDEKFQAIEIYNYLNPNEKARAGLGCCPDNSCWNGYACVEDMTPFSQFAEHISDGRDYRCIEGTWTSSPVKYSWNGDQWGFCPQDNQCFVRPSEPANALVESKFTIKDMYDKNNKASKKYPLCINDKESILDHYCDNGKWTSRTKFIASKLIDIAGEDQYTLYCAPPQQNFLEYDNQEQYIFGTSPTIEDKKPAELGKAKDTKPLQPSCFGFTDEMGKTQLKLLAEDRCINNVCILKFQESGITKTAFATTLNKAATDQDSFLNAFNIEPAKVPTICKGLETDKDKFIKCSLEDLDIKGELWYSPSFNAIMYSKDGITTTTSITDTILKFFQDLLSKTTTPAGKLPIPLLTEAKNVKDIYLYRNGDKQVTAITEIRGPNTTLIAEYKGFTTPICQYMTNFISNDPDLKVQLINQFTGKDKVRCLTTDDNTQRVEAIAGIDIFWPKLTGMLRVEEGK